MYLVDESSCEKVVKIISSSKKHSIVSYCFMIQLINLRNFTIPSHFCNKPNLEYGNVV